MTKKEVVTKLEEAGVEFDSSLSGKELMSQFPDHFEESDGDKSSDSISIKVKDRNAKQGFTVRTFDAETHGEDFAEIAKEFSETNAANIIE